MEKQLDQTFNPEQGRDEVITVFDGLMDAVRKHLQEEYDQQRLRGTDYSKVYVGAMQAVLGNAVNYLIGMSLTNENKQKILADIELVEANTKQVEANTQQIEKQTVLVGAQIDEVLYRVKRLMPLQAEEILEKTNTARITNQQILPAQAEKINADIDLVKVEVQKGIQEEATLKYTREYILPEQRQKASSEVALLQAKKRSEDIQPALINTQISLYQRQREAFDDDYRTKVLKMAVDGWSVLKTVDEGWPARNWFSAPGAYWPSIIPQK